MRICMRGCVLCICIEHLMCLLGDTSLEFTVTLKHREGSHSWTADSRRESQPFSLVQVRSKARCYSGLLVKMHISLKAFSVRACKRTHLAMRGWLHSTEWCRAFLWRFEWIFKSLLHQIHTEWTIFLGQMAWVLHTWAFSEIQNQSFCALGKQNYIYL